MSIYYVYIIECINSKGRHQYYTGYTNNLHRRFLEHQNGKGAKFCRNKKLTLKYIETYPKQIEAMKREREIKSLHKKEKIDLIKTKQL